jgi:polysaccharide biosynthesis transport protein
MPPDDAIHNGNGHPGRLQRPGSPSWPQPSSPGWPADQDQGTRRTTRTPRRLRHRPAVSVARPRFLIAHARWIAAVTLAAVCAAGALALSRTPVYESTAVVLVEPAAVAAGSGQPPDMATEEGVVSSDAVLGIAARSLNVPITVLASGLSTKVPGTTSLLQIRYSDPDPRVAQQRAQAIAQAYASYRSPSKTAAADRRPAGPAPVSTQPSAELITPASLPASPASPNIKIDIGVALIVGLALGIGSAGLRDHLDDRLRGSLDLEAQAAAPVLAVIPARRSRRRNAAGRLIMVTHPDSVTAEAYRGLRTRLVLAATAGNAKTLLVTSPGWEDKSTVAANLAAALAQSGRNVVLMCADLRWGRAHEPFRPPGGEGLAEFLAGRISLMEALRETAVPGLRLLPPGAIPADPGALLQRPALRAAVSGARRHADVVVIEGPPMLASPDIGPLADAAEMALVVADVRRSTRTQVRVALREGEQVRAILAGCVLHNAGRPRRLPSLGPGPGAGIFTAAERWSADGSGAARRVTDADQAGPGRQRVTSSGTEPGGHVRVTTAQDNGRPGNGR